MDIYTSRHSSVPQATEDALYLRPDARKGCRASALVRYAMERLSAMGVRQAVFTSKKTRDIGRFLQRAGCVPVADVYVAQLGTQA